VKKAISNSTRRTYFNNPLVLESLQHLPAALEHPDSNSFKAYLIDHLHFNSEKTRRRMARYIANRFSVDGVMNLDLARAIHRFGDSLIGMEILYFEYIQAIPLLQEIAIRWLAELPEQGTDRASFIAFLELVLGNRSIKKVSKDVTLTFKRFGKLSSPKLSYYCPVWTEPPLEAFLYILARLYPEKTMVRVEMFMNENPVRAMLWPSGSILELLQRAEKAKHISKISQLDQYHQFTLSALGPERMDMLLVDTFDIEQPGDLSSTEGKSTEEKALGDQQLRLFEMKVKPKRKTWRGKKSHGR
jgi:hypothetical protein